MVTTTAEPSNNEKGAGAGGKPTRKSFTNVIKDPKFYPDLPMREDKDDYIGVPLILFDATIRDWEGEFGSSQYCLFKASVNQPGKENDHFIFKLGGVAIVGKVKKALSKRILPSKEGLTLVIGLQESESGKAFYTFMDLD